VNYQLHPAADAELSDAAKYYATAANLRVAHAFLDEFERVAELLEGNQRLGTVAKAGLRVFPFRRFPYSLVYRESENGPRILAVAHHKREPEYWESRG